MQDISFNNQLIAFSGIQKSKTDKGSAIKAQEKPASRTDKKPNFSGAEILASYVRGSIIAQDKGENIKTCIQDLLKENNLLEENERVFRVYFSPRENAVRFRAGDEIEGFRDLYNNNKCGYINFKKDNVPDKIFIKDNKNGEVTAYDCSKSPLLQPVHYSKEDIEALKYYKYHPDAIHLKMRQNRDLYSGFLKEESNEVIKKLIELFDDDLKTFKANEDMTLYRALQDNLSDSDIEKLQTSGEIFTEKSFCSTTKDIQVARRFQNNNPILEINFEKGSKYIDVEKIFNIDREHWSEDEFLLDRNSKFLVEGFDVQNNIIKVKYLGAND